MYSNYTGLTISTNPTGNNVPATVARNGTTFEARNSSSVLDSVVVTGTCASGSTWNGNVCLANVAIGSFTPTYPTIASGTSTNLNWSGVTGGGTITCSINNGVGSATPAASGSKSSGILTTTTNFTITCGNGVGPSAAKSTTVTTVSCASSYFCLNGDRYLGDPNIAPPTCPRTLEACQSGYTCSAGACLAPPSIVFIPFTANDHGSPSGTFEATGHIKAVPSLLQSGGTTWVYWNVNNATSCTVTGSNGDSWTGLSSGVSGLQTSPITGQTTYTLRCDALLGAIPPTITEVDTVNLVPIYRET